MPYRKQLIERFWKYKQETFGARPDLFERDDADTARPPVFLKQAADHNLLIDPGCPAGAAEAIVSMIPVEGRHKWFCSMSSSQALAQTLFGNLRHTGLLPLLRGLRCEDGLAAFDDWRHETGTMELEHDVKHLGEPRPTSIDVFFQGDYAIAVECKLTEQDIGVCSRANAETRGASHDGPSCDGNYHRQGGRIERCPLTEIGILYWKYVPFIFNWDSCRDNFPCPLRSNYQLVRNVLTVAYKETERNGHALLLYDERNPAFQPGGAAWNSFAGVSGALRDRSLLRRVSWQALLKHLRKGGLTNWLSDNLASKYGL